MALDTLEILLFGLAAVSSLVRMSQPGPGPSPEWRQDRHVSAPDAAGMFLKSGAGEEPGAWGLY